VGTPRNPVGDVGTEAFEQLVVMPSFLETQTIVLEVAAPRGPQHPNGVIDKTPQEPVALTGVSGRF